MMTVIMVNSPVATRVAAGKGTLGAIRGAMT